MRFADISIDSVTSERCNHLVIDAGRVLVESELASKETLREIEKKRNTKYSDEDYKQLESMMYDNFSVKLVAAQVRRADVFSYHLSKCFVVRHWG